MVLGLPLLLVAPQIVLGHERLWLPPGLRRRSIRRAELVKLITRILPLVVRGEKLVRPRLQFLTSPTGVRMIGVAYTFAALILVFPIPFANLAPATALSLFALGLTRKDGLFVLAGYGLLAMAVLLIAAGVTGIALAIHHIVSLL